jgi:hypothetical protein
MTILFALAAVVLILTLAVIVLHRAIRRLLRALNPAWLWFSGHPMDGVARTNATWLSPSHGPRPVLHPSGHAVAWHHMPRMHRAAIRTTASLVLLLLAYGLVTAFVVTVVFLCVAAGLAVAAGIWHLAYRIRFFRHERHYVRPLERSLTSTISAAPLSLDVSRDGDAVRSVAIEWPAEAEISDSDKDSVLQAVTARLGIEAPEASWSLRGRSRSVVFTQSDPPPSRVRWGDVQQAVLSAAPDELMCGLGKKHAGVFVSTQLDSPHFGIAMGTGGGKSNTAAFWLVQELRRGAVALILDAKWFSHPWTFKDMNAEYGQLPNVAYARTTEQLHRAMIWLGVELQRRTEAADRMVNAKGDILGDVGPTMWIIAEELNLAVPRLKQYWASVRDQEDPKRSPALDGLAAVSFAGRAVRMHLIPIGQMLTAAALGGGDVRENIGVRMMARYTANSWKMQTDLPMPPPSDVPGRVQVIASGSVREAQVPLMDLEECREMAVAGIVTPCPDDMPGIAPAGRVLLPASPESASDLGFVLGQPAGRPPGTMTLREAAAEGLFPSLAAARKAVQRRGLEPAARDGSSNLYYTAELARTLRSE